MESDIEILSELLGIKTSDIQLDDTRAIKISTILNAMRKVRQQMKDLCINEQDIDNFIVKKRKNGKWIDEEDVKEFLNQVYQT